MISGVESSTRMISARMIVYHERRTFSVQERDRCNPRRFASFREAQMT